MAQRNRQQRNRSDYDRNREQGREQYGRDDRDRYYADDVGLQNLSNIDEPWWRDNPQQLRERNQQSQGNYGRGQEDYGRNYGRTQHFDESIAGRPSGFQGDYGYRA